jgi:hypothetical protein
MNLVKFFKKPGHLAASIVHKGQHGVAQIRAITPLDPIRRALQMQAHRRGGGFLSGDIEAQCERDAVRLAGIGLLYTIAEAARAPQTKSNKKRNRVMRKAQQLVQMKQSGTLDGMGGWPAVAQAVQRKHVACARALKARGMSNEDIAKTMKSMMAEDSAAIQHAVSATEGEMSGFSLTNLARKAMSVSEKLSPSHYLMRKVAPGLERFSPSHQVANAFKRAGAPNPPPYMPPGAYSPRAAQPAGANFSPFAPSQASQAAQNAQAAQAEMEQQANAPVQFDESSPMDYQMEAQDATQPPSDQPVASYDDAQTEE